MASIQVQDVTKRYGQKKLFEDVTVNFTEGSRYGLTGPNGAGKSTFMKILAGDLEPDTGIGFAARRRPRVLKQDQFAYEDVRVLDVVLHGQQEAVGRDAGEGALLAKADITDERASASASSSASSPRRTATPPSRTRPSSSPASAFPKSEHEKPMSELPGGFKLRVLLAQALFGKPEALLLDEPTNNLDLDGIRWLERFLRATRAC